MIANTTPPDCEAPGPAGAAGDLAALDRSIVRATQAGLPVVARPYHEVAARAGVPVDVLLERLAVMLADGRIRRIGMVPNHYALGYRANGMTVWDIDDARIDALGAAVGALPFVSHCYRRRRHLPEWPYNLFAMVHAHSRAEAQAQVDTIARLVGDACRARDVLYSTRILKKTGVRLTYAPALAPAGRPATRDAATTAGPKTSTIPNSPAGSTPPDPEADVPCSV